MNDDTISRQAAIDALGEEPPVWYDGEDEIAERNQWRRDVAAIKALPSAQPEQRWIPCEERLPQESQNVLTIDRYGDYEINHIIEDEEWYWEPSPVAWMPLPEPYKEHADAD